MPNYKLVETTYVPIKFILLHTLLHAKNCVVFNSNQMINPHSGLRGNFITKNTMKYIYYHCYYGNRADKFMKMYYFRHKMSN